MEFVHQDIIVTVQPRLLVEQVNTNHQKWPLMIHSVKLVHLATTVKLVLQIFLCILVSVKVVITVVRAAQILSKINVNQVINALKE